MKPLLEQSEKDSSLLKNQRSSMNIGVVVGNLLGSLFKKAVDLIEEVESSFHSIFKNERFSFCFFIRSVYNHCDTLCHDILTHYVRVRDVKVVIDNTNQLLQQYITAEDGKENQQLDGLNQVLNEISLFLQHHESFHRFFSGKGNDAFLLASQGVSSVELQHYQSKVVLPVEFMNELSLIQQKQVIPQGKKCIAYPVWLCFLSHCRCFSSCLRTTPPWKSVIP